MRSSRVLAEDRVDFFGHENILATHRNTLEITREGELSIRGDCVVGVLSTKGCLDLSAELKNHIRRGRALEFELLVGSASFSFSGTGHADLALTHRKEIVLRKSDYLSDRTGAICCTAAAVDVPRSMISMLREPARSGSLLIRATDSIPPEFVWSLP